MKPTLRSEWGTHFSLDPELIYLNHGAFGACPLVVQAAQREFRDRLERNPVHFFVRELEGLLDQTRGVLGPFLGARSEDLAFVPNATAGVNTVLSALEFQAGDEIVINDHTYPACRNAVQYWAARRSLHVRVCNLPFPFSAADELRAAILAQVTPRTKLVLLDHVTSPSGIVMPIRELVSALQARGIDTLVDGAHAPACWRWISTPWAPPTIPVTCTSGAARPRAPHSLWVRRDKQALIHPLVISHGWAAPRSDRPRFLLEFDWTGTLDASAILSVPSALAFLSQLFSGGFPALYAHNHALAVRARELLVRGSRHRAALPRRTTRLARGRAVPEADPQNAPRRRPCTTRWSRAVSKSRSCPFPAIRRASCASPRRSTTRSRNSSRSPKRYGKSSACRDAPKSSQGVNLQVDRLGMRVGLWALLMVLACGGACSPDAPPKYCQTDSECGTAEVCGTEACTGIYHCLRAECACVPGGFRNPCSLPPSKCNCDHATCEQPFDSCGQYICAGVCKPGQSCQVCVDPGGCDFAEPCLSSTCQLDGAGQAVCRSDDCLLGPMTRPPTVRQRECPVWRVFRGSLRRHRVRRRPRHGTVVRHLPRAPLLRGHHSTLRAGRRLHEV